MIIDFHVNFNNYKDKIFNYYGFWHYKCPCCNTRNSFTRHGSYVRNLCLINLSGIQEFKIKILRLCCNSCETTHAVLPPEAIPYCIYSFSFMLYVFIEHFVHNKNILKLSEKLNTSFQIIYVFISKLSSQLNKCISFLRAFLAVQLDYSSSFKEVISIVSKYKDFQKDYLVYTKSVFMMTRNVLSRNIYIVAYSKPPT